MHDLYRSLVIQYKLVSHEYFLTKMNPYEAYLLNSVADWSMIEYWRLGRNMMFYSAAGNLKKSVKSPKDLFTLADEKDDLPTETTDKQKALFKQMKRQMGR